MKPKVDFKRFLVEMFGSPQGLLSFLRSYDAPLPGAEAVSKWFYRESVPGDWLFVIFSYLNLERDVPRLGDFWTTGE